MAKHQRELENPILTSIYTFRQPNQPPRVTCKCGCGKEIDKQEDSYIIVDDNFFWDAEHVTDYFISQAGGRRVWGGFDDAS